MPVAGSTLIGEICSFGFNFAPAGFALCGGQIVGISQQTALFSLLGTWFGGDGRTTFGYPNLTSRTPVGFNMGGGIGLTPYNMGQKGGFEDITLVQSQIPAHNHLATFTPGASTPVTGTLTALSSGPTTATPSTGMKITGGGGNLMFSTGPSGFQQEVDLGGLTLSGGGSSGGTVAIGNTGSNHAHENRMPFQAICYGLCEDGIYPSRN
jgi:microcystin-dependent protein